MSFYSISCHCISLNVKHWAFKVSTFWIYGSSLNQTVVKHYLLPHRIHKECHQVCDLSLDRLGYVTYCKKNKHVLQMFLRKHLNYSSIEFNSFPIHKQIRSMIWAQFCLSATIQGVWPDVWLGFTVNSPNTPQVCIVTLIFYCSWSNLESPPSLNIYIRYVYSQPAFDRSPTIANEKQAGMCQQLNVAHFYSTQVLHQPCVFSGTISCISGVWSG